MTEEKIVKLDGPFIVEEIQKVKKPDEFENPEELYKQLIEEINK